MRRKTDSQLLTCQAIERDGMKGVASHSLALTEWVIERHRRGMSGLAIARALQGKTTYSVVTGIIAKYKDKHKEI
jgi:hypothetical protein